MKWNSIAPNTSFNKFHSLGNSVYKVSSWWNSFPLFLHNYLTIITNAHVPLYLMRMKPLRNLHWDYAITRWIRYNEIKATATRKLIRSCRACLQLLLFLTHSKTPAVACSWWSWSAVSIGCLARRMLPASNEFFLAWIAIATLDLINCTVVERNERTDSMMSPC